MILNFRKIKQEFSSSIANKGQILLENCTTPAVNISSISSSAMKISGSFIIDNAQISTIIEFDKDDSSIIDSECSCGAKADCQHIFASTLFFEKNFNNIVSKQIDCEKGKEQTHQILNSEAMSEIKSSINKTSKVNSNNTLREYKSAMKLLSNSTIFVEKDLRLYVSKEIKKQKFCLFILNNWKKNKKPTTFFVKIAIKSPGRKLVFVQNIRDFQNKCRKCATLKIHANAAPVELTSRSFDESSQISFNYIKNAISPSNAKSYIGEIDAFSLGDLINKMRTLSTTTIQDEDGEDQEILNDLQIFTENNEKLPFKISKTQVRIACSLASIYIPAPRIMTYPTIVVNDVHIEIEKCFIVESENPILILEDTIYTFSDEISASHIKSLGLLKQTTIPEALLGTFIEKCLPQLKKISEISGLQQIQEIKTIPLLSKEPKAKCFIDISNGTLEAQLYFEYNDILVPYNPAHITIEHINSFKTIHGSLERAIYYESEVHDSLFSLFNESENGNVQVCKSEKSIIYFMTVTIPELSKKIEFKISESLQKIFVYDNPTASIHAESINNNTQVLYTIKTKSLFYGESIKYISSLIQQGSVACKNKNCKKDDSTAGSVTNRHFTVLSKATKNILYILNHISADTVKDQEITMNYWTVSKIICLQQTYKDSPNIKISIDSKILETFNNIAKEKTNCHHIPMRNLKNLELRPYQVCGINWLKYLQSINCNALLSDDMGLGKTIQIICLISDYASNNPGSLSIVLCPSILTTNWRKEFNKFSNINIGEVTGTPTVRHKIINNARENALNVLIISYASAQKDVDIISNHNYDYLIIDEAQYIKNKETQNHLVSKKITSKYIIAATGTPIENMSLELTNIINFLMNGMLSDIKNIKKVGKHSEEDIKLIKETVSPFIIRRLKKDVLKDLPPISETETYCDLSPVQHKLYSAYSKQAMKDLAPMIKQDGIQKSRLHIFKCLTKLKQICCHPGLVQPQYILSKTASEKYTLLMSMIETIINSSRRTVIFSQYKSMLDILSNDLKAGNIKYCYIHGNTKNKEKELDTFDTDHSIKIFLISIKAGGVGLNITSADTVIHYDLCWNPSIQSQATDRVYRLGQNKHVLVYKLITSNTIEEKILKIQQNKKELAANILKQTPYEYDNLNVMTLEDVQYFFDNMNSSSIKEKTSS
ncbi:MAG: SNF2 helicase associated domain-containing protein [Chlamydiia bacterium]|nr:SNF2 helicase associated domain-containing protein [Chlamydiia bacterium]